ncbi:Uncharacterised protein [Ralstonia pickettii]|uniref:hypothetical protein n=1 Tax=Ralstonia pickettii TaxID=329 RepID=UPI000508443A|nr:hypothetical protein [Ralstonia pickettii]KFL24363.1 hypothetical protein DP23_4085 [Ralstonia pickettii]QQK36987.1 hypothetical protein RP6297_03225 [Ralstonia pickettii]UCA15808.1 hypothetical protein LA354_07395 [Ralstonia pickettii]SUE01053.1 Uncharacterised protein [Ralstonia pickettii]
MANADEVKAAASDVNSAIGLIQSLCRFAYKAEDTEDFEAFHGLMWDLLPQIGLRLDCAKAALGKGRTGFFADGTMSGMFSANAN